MYTIISDELTAQLTQPIRLISSQNRSTGTEVPAPEPEVCPRPAILHPWTSPYPDDRSWQAFLTGLLDQLDAHPECRTIVHEALRRMEQAREG